MTAEAFTCSTAAIQRLTRFRRMASQLTGDQGCHDDEPSKTLGIVGFGAFRRLIARYLYPHFDLVVSDPALCPDAPLPGGVRVGDNGAAGACDLVILAVPIDALAAALDGIHPHLRPGSTVVDVVSVKVEWVRIMRAMLPDHVEIVGAHPLFGPQSAHGGIAGRKIALCRVHGGAVLWNAAFLRRVLGLKV
ncbi:MAG: prephenate dehydrogenase/arogenate dehydrogenase family protein [Rhodospirillaceae bacterium]